MTIDEKFNVNIEGKLNIWYLTSMKIKMCSSWDWKVAM